MLGDVGGESCSCLEKQEKYCFQQCTFIRLLICGLCCLVFAGCCWNISETKKEKGFARSHEPPQHCCRILCLVFRNKRKRSYAPAFLLVDHVIGPTGTPGYCSSCNHFCRLQLNGCILVSASY
jgi:hypothetical protein